jgi:hypothetical protein
MIGDNYPRKGLFNPDDLGGFVCTDNVVRNAQVLLRLDVLECPTVISLDGAKLMEGLDCYMFPRAQSLGRHSHLLRHQLRRYKLHSPFIIFCTMYRASQGTHPLFRQDGRSHGDLCPHRNTKVYTPHHPSEQSLQRCGGLNCSIRVQTKRKAKFTSR